MADERLNEYVRMDAGHLAEALVATEDRLAAAERRAKQADKAWDAAVHLHRQAEYDLAVARSQLREAQAALRKVEWASVFHIANKMVSGCPECAHSQADGHAADCIVGRALASPPTQGPTT